MILLNIYAAFSKGLDEGLETLIKSEVKTNIEITKAVMELLIANDKDFSIDNIFIIASKHNEVNIVRLLLEDPFSDRNVWVDPAAKNNKAIRRASLYDNIEIIRLLLEDPRGETKVSRSTLYAVDPSGDQSGGDHPISSASMNGHTEIVRLLLAHPKVDPTVENNDPINSASKYGYIEIVRLLLADSRVNPNDDDTYDSIAIVGASEFGNVDILRLLLKDPRGETKVRGVLRTP